MNTTRRTKGADAIALVLVVAFSALGLWGLMRDGTLGTVSAAIATLHADVQTHGIAAVTAGARLTHDLSEHWRPWGTDAARIEEVMAYSFLASWFMAMFLGAVRTKIVPAFASIARSRARGQRLVAFQVLEPVRASVQNDASFGTLVCQPSPFLSAAPALRARATAYREGNGASRYTPGIPCLPSIASTRPLF